MSSEIVDDDDDSYSADEFESPADNNSPDSQESDARRRIEELMEKRRLRALLKDPYMDGIEEE